MAPLYDFACSEGHVTEKFRRMTGRIPKSVKCGSCPLMAARIFSRPSVQDDFPIHYNWSIGEVVRSRAHMKRIQKDRGLQDWEPCRNSPGSQLSKDASEKKAHV